jgi:polar amino acid transport system substrate-binding protein
MKMLFLLTLLPLAPCALGAAPGAGEPPALVFVMQPFPPYTATENGQPSGFFADVMHEVCNSMQARCRIEIYPWRRALAMTMGGGVDGALMVRKTPERLLALHFSPAIVQSSYVLYAQQQSTLRYAGPADLAGYTVAAYGPSGTSRAAEALVQKIPGARFQLEIDNQTALRKLRSGRYGKKAVVVINKDLGQYLLRQEGGAALKQIGELEPVEYYIALSRKRLPQQQVERFNSILLERMRDGTVAAIARKYGLKAARAD